MPQGLQAQALSINYGQGINTKSDPKLVINGQLTALQNALFTKQGQIKKRNGYDALSLNVAGSGVISEPLMVKALDNQLMAIASGPGATVPSVFSYVPSQQNWIFNGSLSSQGATKQHNQPDGSIECTSVSTEIVDSDNAHCYQYQDYVVSGSAGLFVENAIESVELGPANAVTAIVKAFVLDVSTKDVLASIKLENDQLGLVNPKACLLGGSVFSFIYMNIGGAFANTTLNLVTVSFSGGVYTFNAPIILATTSATTDTSVNVLDIASTPSGAVISYSFGPEASDNIHVIEINTSGTIVNSTSFSNVAAVTVTNVTYDISTGNTWVYWTEQTNATANNQFYAVVNSSLGTILGRTHISGSSNLGQQITSVIVNATTQIMYFSTSFSITNTGPTGSQQILPTQLWSFTVTSAGAVSMGSLPYYYNQIGIMDGVQLYSRPFTIGPNTYVWLNYWSNIQSTLFLYNLTNNSWAAKALAGSVISSAFANIQTIGHLSTPTVFGNTAIIPAGYITEDLAIPINATLSVPTSFFPAGSELLTVNFSDENANQAVIAGDVLMINGSIPRFYDTKIVREVGFNVFPEYVTLTAEAGGNLSAGSYQYFVIFQRADNFGNLYRSAPSIGATILLNGTTQTAVDLSFLGPIITDNSADVTVLIYRTVANGTTPFLIQALYGMSATTNPQTINQVMFFNDQASDVSIEGNEILYTNGGVIENTAPPPTMLMTVHNNRVWVVDTENPNTISYTKSIEPGVGLSFSDLLTIQVETRNGPITGLQGMDEKLVIFTEDKPYFIVGDGPNDTGNNSTLSLPQVMPAGTGCSQNKSIVLLPTGILRMTQKGFYLMDRGLNDQYIGASVEAFNNQTYTSSVLTPDTTQCRILTSSGLTLLYDYFFNQWGSFTNHTGVAADIWNGFYVYARTDDNIYYEDESSFLDASTSYQLVAQFSNLKFTAVQGFQRVKKFNMLGDHTTPGTQHGLQVTASYDFGFIPTSPIPYFFGQAGATSGVFTYQEHLPMQKCASLTLLIEELITGAAGEYLDLTDMTLEVAIKKGLNKLPPNYQVG